MKKIVIVIIGVSLILIGMYFSLNVDKFYEKRNEYGNAYVLGGRNMEDRRKANFYSSLEEFGKKGSTPCIIIGGILFGVSFLIKDRKEQ